MQQAVSARTPAHLWVVGILSLLWNCLGCFDYLMSNLKNQAYLSKFSPDMVTYMNGLPAWTTGMWAIGVWGGLAGAILLLIRSRYAVWAFGLSLIGAVVGLGYQMFMTVMPRSMNAGMMKMMPWVIIAIAACQLWYAWSMEKNGVLR
jgi:hypothetical protein